MERLQRVLASSGIASRRKAEQLIAEGRVSVDGRVVRDLGTRVDPERQRIEVDGRPVRWERRRYIMLNKPTGYITTAADERGRRTVLDLVDVPERVVPVGRLDRKTSGLLLLTNDGELQFRVTHPRFELEKEYEVLVDGHPPPDVLEQLRRGVTVDGEKVATRGVRPLRNEEAGTVLRITIHEGRNRIVRRMLERVGYPALKLARVRVGPLHVKGVPVGGWRDLTPGELEQLQEAVGLRGLAPEQPEHRQSRPPPRRGGPRRQEQERERERRPVGPRPAGHRGRRPGGGRQEHRGERGRRPD